jgi:adenine-specific DNA-methyltransferase
MARSTRTTARTPAATVDPAAAVKDYRHQQEATARPDAGAAPRFRAKRETTTYRYDSSLSPALDWDTNPARDTASWLLTAIEEAAALPNQTFPTMRELRGADGTVLMRVAGLQDALAALKRMQAPFLNWTGKAERLSFDVPTLPLFVHERLSTEAIVQTLEGHRKRAAQEDQFSLFGDPQMPMSKQVDAYAYRNGWVNRMILGDSLSVMNSLARFEGLSGQVQCIYMDPPYGVKFGSNFQPFVRKPDVKNNDDADMTREPEMVQAYRDTWSLGLHSYLTYLRDRLTVSRDLLTKTGSIFVQISDDNLHHVREVMDEVFGSDNFVSLINFQTTSGFDTNTIATLGDYLLWYARDKSSVWASPLFIEQRPVLGEGNAKWVLLSDSGYRGVTAAERRGEVPLPKDSRLYMPDNIQSQNPSREAQPFDFQGRTWLPNSNAHWKANYPNGMQRLADAGRLHVASNSLRYRRFHSDFPFQQIGNIWTDTITGNFTDEKLYVVRTNPKVVQRCPLLLR